MVKKLKKQPIYLCYFCSKDIMDDKFVFIKTRQGSEIRIHDLCMEKSRLRTKKEEIKRE